MKKMILTLGPSLFEVVSNIMPNSKHYIFRINGSHTGPAEMKEYVAKIRGVAPDAKILIDLPGNKVRTGDIDPISIEVGKDFKIATKHLNFPDFYRYIEKGDVVWSNDSEFQFIVKETSQNEITFTSKSRGVIKQNKGLHVRGINEKLPFLFERDKKIIEFINENTIDYIGLSFVRSPEDVKHAKKMITKKTEVICKIETRAAVANLDAILKESRSILIDRGDLSADVGITRVPIFQKYIIDRGLFNNNRIFLATQFLKNMEEKPIPTIAEAIDLYNTLKMGIYGIQLSEETAVGKYPSEAVNFVQGIIDEINQEHANNKQWASAVSY